MKVRSRTGPASTRIAHVGDGDAVHNDVHEAQRPAAAVGAVAKGIRGAAVARGGGAAARELQQG